MDVTCFLATVLLCLVIYISVKDSIVNPKKKDQSKKVKNIREYFTCLDLPWKIEFFSMLIFAGIFLYLLFTHFPVVLAILTIPGLVVYVLVPILTPATTWKVVRSGDRARLKPLEKNR